MTLYAFINTNWMNKYRSIKAREGCIVVWCMATGRGDEKLRAHKLHIISSHKESSSLSLDHFCHIFDNLLQVIVRVPAEILAGILVFQHPGPAVS